MRAIGSKWWWIGGAAFLAIFAYTPLLAVRPGVVTANTKTYLYLDPVRFLKQVALHVGPHRGAGHRRPTNTSATCSRWGRSSPSSTSRAFFAVVAQRLWLGSILMGAGVGVLYLSRILGLRGPGPTAGPRWPTCCRPTSCSTPAAFR